MKLPLSNNNKKLAGQLLAIALGALILTLLVRTLGDIRFDDVVTAIREIPPRTVGLAIGLAICGYLWIVGYDYLALRFLRRSVPWPRLVLTSLAAFALQRNVGPGPLTGGALRYRYYRGHDFSAGDAAVITLLCAFAFTLGIALTAGWALLLEPRGLAGVLGIPSWPLRIAGGLLLLGLAGYIYWTSARHHPIRLGSWEAPAPSARVSLLQLLFGAVDIAIVAGVAYLLLPEQVELSYPAFVGLYVLAMVAGAVSHVPGGLGVFESVLLLLLPGDAPASSVLASLLAFRGVYYLLPLLTMIVGVGGYELGLRLLRREA